MSLFNNRQRPILSQVVEALQQLQNDPEQLSDERERRYNDPPPPYPESGETTQPPTPRPPVVDEFYEEQEKRIALFKSTPHNQFQSQAKRERERLEYQISHKRFGRRQTLSWDMSLDLKANPENNVRSRWVEQGIWGDEWGPEWPKNSCPLTTKWTHPGGGPFIGPHSTDFSDCFPGGRWGHEEYSPELEYETESESEPQSDLSIFGSAPRQPKPREPRPRRRRPMPKELGPIPSYLIPRPTVRNPEASRPYHQFLFQVSKEREWIKDELDYKARGTAVDIDALAYHSVKDNWIQDGIWIPRWGDMPGMKWLYEEVEEEQRNEEGTVEAPAAEAATVEQSHEPVDDGRQATRRSRSPFANIFAPTQIPNGANSHSDDSSAPTRTNAEASVPEASSSGHPAVTPSVEGTQHTTRRSPRKRSRASDAAEDPQPKRLRRNRDSALLRNVSDPPSADNPQKSRTVTTRAKAKAKTLPGDKMAVPTSSKKRGERVKSESSPPRRSARIAEREKRQKANAAGTLSPKPPRAKTAKKAKKPRVK